MEPKFKKGDLVRYITDRQRIGLVLGIGKHPLLDFEKDQRPVYRILWSEDGVIAHTFVDTADWMWEKASP